jgi:hypothetical protein
VLTWQVGADSGHSKYGKAKELKTPLIDEAGLFAMIAATAPPADAPSAPQQAAFAAAAVPQAPPHARHAEAGPSAAGPSAPGAAVREGLQIAAISRP